SRARVIQMALRERIHESRNNRSRRRRPRIRSAQSATEPACSRQHNTAEPELPKYEPPPPAYAPSKIVVHD
ncbi:hypothetical protein IWW43_007023, partial [Coemansia sp. RSA 1935]